MISDGNQNCDLCTVFTVTKLIMRNCLQRNLPVLVLLWQCFSFLGLRQTLPPYSEVVMLSTRSATGGTGQRIFIWLNIISISG